MRDHALSVNQPLGNEVANFYRARFWQPLQADKWADGDVADVFDCAVNCGLHPAVEALQRALGFDLRGCDGHVGPETLAAVERPSAGLRAAFAAQRALHYAKIVRRDPKQAEWLFGWLQRALAFALPVAG